MVGRTIGRITGDIPKKRKEFVFLLPAHGAQDVVVDEALFDQFHGDDQVSQWQKNAFPKDMPDDKSRARDGLLPTDLSGVGEPVFFLREPDASGQPQTHVFRAGLYVPPAVQESTDRSGVPRFEAARGHRLCRRAVWVCAHSR